MLQRLMQKHPQIRPVTHPFLGGQQAGAFDVFGIDANGNRRSGCDALATALRGPRKGLWSRHWRQPLPSIRQSRRGVRPTTGPLLFRIRILGVALGSYISPRQIHLLEARHGRVCRDGPDSGFAAEGKNDDVEFDAT